MNTKMKQITTAILLASAIGIFIGRALESYDSAYTTWLHDSNNNEAKTDPPEFHTIQCYNDVAGCYEQ